MFVGKYNYQIHLVAEALVTVPNAIEQNPVYPFTKFTI